MLTIRPESEPAIRWARDISNALDELAFQVYASRTRARVTLEDCLERLRVYGCETQSPYAPVDTDKCETSLAHERGVMFLWSSRMAGQTSPWINGGLVITLPASVAFLDAGPRQPVDALCERLRIATPTLLDFEAMTWGTHT